MLMIPHPKTRPFIEEIPALSPTFTFAFHVCFHVSPDIYRSTESGDRTRADRPGMKTTYVLAAVLAFLSGAVVRQFVPATAAARPLQVHVYRGPLGLTMANGEPATLSDCTVAASDHPSDDWIATIDWTHIAPGGDVLVPWAAFVRNGDTLSPTYGLSRDTFRVECFAGDAWKSAAFRAGTHF